MNKKARYGALALGLTVMIITAVVLWASQATATRHAASLSPFGQSSSWQAMVSSLRAGEKVALSTIKSADWTAPLSGLINLNHPSAKNAALEDKEEPIQIYAHHLEHPIHGDFLIDTGVSTQFIEDPYAQGIPAFMLSPLGFDRLQLLTSTEVIIEKLAQPVRGVFLTHLHLDHISGLPAIDKHVPVYVGQGESTERFMLFAATRGIVDTVLHGRPPLREWPTEIVDIFSDGSVFAIHVPGHTAGSTAYLVNTTSGPVLLVGDASHTVWGWEHGVEPGKFSTDQPRSRDSLNRLRTLVKDNPEIEVRLGHQD